TEQTGSTRAGQVSGQDAAQQPAPVAKSAPAPAAATNSPEMVEAMARDLDEYLRMVQKGSNFSAWLPAPEPLLFVPKQRPPTAEDARAGGPARDPNYRPPTLTLPPSKQVPTVPVRRSAQDAAQQPAPVTQTAPDAAPQPGFENDQFASQRPSIGRRTFRTLAR